MIYTLIWLWFCAAVACAMDFVRLNRDEKLRIKVFGAILAIIIGPIFVLPVALFLKSLRRAD